MLDDRAQPHTEGSHIRSTACIGLFGLAALAPLAAHAQRPDDVIEVLGETPLGGDVPAARVAANVQSATAEALREQRALDLADFLRRNLASVFVNEAQSNVLQPDVQYRGFVGSPLLGLPQGIAVYQDGVRLNEPFGDTVNWALIPESAIDSVYLMPGSNPLFGLNALGGAIVVETKDGFSHAGVSAEVLGGSFGRKSAQAAVGGATEALGYFVTGQILDEDGWRAHSPTEAAQLFGSLGWRLPRTELDLGVSLSDTDLIGNGAAPVQLLAVDRQAVFTRPDRTENALALVNLKAVHAVSDALTLRGNLYFRGSNVDTYNGDDSELEACDHDPEILCEDEDEPVLDPAGNPLPAIDAVEGATINRTRTAQDGAGFGLQASWIASLRGRENRFTAGLLYDRSAIDFAASTELGSLDATRLAVPSGFFLGDALTQLKAKTSNFGWYVSNTFSLRDRMALTVAGRYNDTRIRLRDGLGTELNGDHDFHRLNPSLGVTAAVASALTVYGGYSESSRAPSPVELTCADEDDPCKLPNAFLADPPLEQVVAKTFEAGVRRDGQRVDWRMGLFRTDIVDDILFVSAGARTNQGYFDNIGRTRRDGVELGSSGIAGGIQWFANYTYLVASFREHLTLPSPNNPTAVEGEVTVQRGDDLPLVPNHLFKLGANFTMTDRLSLGATVRMSSSFRLRGDEGNDVARIGRYGVLDLRADVRLGAHSRLVLNVDNVLDERYETFGVFGDADEVLGDAFDDRRFVSPAAPRAAWIGVQFDR